MNIIFNMVLNGTNRYVFFDFSNFSIKLLLSCLSVCIIANQFESGNGSPVACYHNTEKFWHPEPLYHTYNATKCGVTCPTNCTCGLGSYQQVLVECGNESRSYTVQYPANLTQLLWVGSTSLGRIQNDSFVGLVDTLTYLYLYNNGLEYLQAGVFEALTNLKGLDLGINRLKYVDADVFRGQWNLIELVIGQNHFLEIYPSMFHRLANLERLYLYYSNLRQLKVGMFNGLKNLTHIRLEGNLLKHIPSGVFVDMPKLENLNIIGNRLTQIDPGAFAALATLQVLLLEKNNLATLHPDVFANLTRLEVLVLSSNKLQALPKQTLRNLRMLTVLGLDDNNLNEFDSGSFENCNLSSLDIADNRLKWIDSDSFAGLNHYTKVFVNESGMCCLLGNKATCYYTEEKSPFLTCQRLLPYIFLRGTLWIVGLLAIVGNIVGNITRCVKKRQINEVQFLLITNLSISDLLMGVYLVILLSVDWYYGGHFPANSESWRRSALCKFAGSLCVLSSEASVFFITLISFDRFQRVKYPLSRKLMSPKSGRVVVCVMWMVAFGIGILSYVLPSINTNFYDVSEICVGLPFSRYYNNNMTYHRVQITKRYDETREVVQHATQGTELAMYFSIVIFIILNFVCFAIVCVCYAVIFVHVRKSAKKSGRSSISKNEIRMAKKMSLIVITDFCCWLPIGVVSILVQAGAMEISAIAYAWVATFVLPINSSINPFLYTLGDAFADKKLPCSGDGNRANSSKYNRVEMQKQDNNLKTQESVVKQQPLLNNN